MLQQIKKASVPERLSYQFHMLHAAALLRQEQPKVALEELELAEFAEHSDGKQQGDLFRLKAACWSKLERHDLAKECLFQSSVVRSSDMYHRFPNESMQITWSFLFRLSCKPMERVAWCLECSWRLWQLNS